MALMEQSQASASSKDDYSNPPVVETVIGIELLAAAQLRVRVERSYSARLGRETPKRLNHPRYRPGRPAAQGTGFEIQFGGTGRRIAFLDEREVSLLMFGLCPRSGVAHDVAPPNFLGPGVVVSSNARLATSRAS